MELGDEDARDTAQRIAASAVAEVPVVLCPSFTALPAVADALRGSAVLLGAQDCAGAERGARTGEVSPEDLQHLGCRYVIVGHSERRQLLGETDALVAAKVHAALRAGLRPVCCIGETDVEHRAGMRDEVLRRQLRTALASVTLDGAQELCIAYEPVWAIGTGYAATLEDVREAHAVIRATIAECADAETASRIIVLYGGSVDPQRIAALTRLEGIAGVLVGTAAQTAARIRALVQALQ